MKLETIYGTHTIDVGDVVEFVNSRLGPRNDIVTSQLYAGDSVLLKVTAIHHDRITLTCAFGPRVMWTQDYTLDALKMCKLRVYPRPSDYEVVDSMSIDLRKYRNGTWEVASLLYGYEFDNEAEARKFFQAFEDCDKLFECVDEWLAGQEDDA